MTLTNGDLLYVALCFAVWTGCIYGDAYWRGWRRGKREGNAP
jgi:hypothetical protein